MHRRLPAPTAALQALPLLVMFTVWVNTYFVLYKVRRSLFLCGLLADGKHQIRAWACFVRVRVCVCVCVCKGRAGMAQPACPQAAPLQKALAC